MIELIENFGLWMPGIFAILCGILWSISLSRSLERNEEKTNFKLIKGKNTKKWQKNPEKLLEESHYPNKTC